MNSIFERINFDLNILKSAVLMSKKDPFFIFEELGFILGTIVLAFFLTAIGRRVFRFLRIETDFVSELIFCLGLGIILWGTLVLILGIVGILFSQIVWGVAIVIFSFGFGEARKILSDLKNQRVSLPKSKFENILTLIFLALVFWNFIGALTPEKGVDAIGYHLYFPKVYLEHGTMMLPARGSRLFSLFPHLASMIYLLPVSLNLPNITQLFHFGLGILTAINLRLIVQRYSKKNSLALSLIFYSVLTIGSVSRSAYSDFFITFFLSLSLLAIEEYVKKRRNWWLVSGIMLGGTLATKNQSLAFLPLIFFIFYLILRVKAKELFKILLVTFLPPILWYIRSIIIAGTPFYPLLSLKDPRVPQFSLGYSKFQFLRLIRDIFLFQPFFLFLLSGFLILLVINTEKKWLKTSLWAVLTCFYWVLLPESFHDWRYFLPYYLLIVFLASNLIYQLLTITFFRYGLIVVSFCLLVPRVYTSSLYLPYIFGLEEKRVFLSNALRTRIEDFYDVDGRFARFIAQNNRVLIDGVLGLYYVDFPFQEFEYSAFFQKELSLVEFEKAWKNQNFSYLILKNMSLSEFLGKMGIGWEKEEIFVLKVADEQSKTYLYQPKF